MSEIAPLPRFDIVRVLAGMGQTLWRQRRPLIVAGLFAGFLPAFLATQATARLSALVGQFGGPNLLAYDLELWAWWALRIPIWVAVNVVAMAPVVWLTLSDQAGRPVSLDGARDMLTRAFWPLFLVGLMNDVRTWGRPLGYLLPLTNAPVLTDALLRLGVLLLTAWFGIAASVVIEERAGFRRALARSAYLTRGRRLIMAGLGAGVLMVIEALWRPIHDLVDLLGVINPVAHSAFSYLLFQIPWVLVIVFETMLYVEMRRLRDPVPAPEAVGA